MIRQLRLMLADQLLYWAFRVDPDNSIEIYLLIRGRGDQ